MAPKPGSWQDLEGNERSIAQLAEAVRQDVFDNGTRRHYASGGDVDRSAVEANGFTNNGNTSRLYAAWQCDECGQTHLGFEAAAECCTDDLEVDDIDDEEEAERERLYSMGIVVCGP